MKAKVTFRGFTLIELMITLALFAILIAAAAPSISTYLESRKVRNVADSIVSGMQQARALAVRQNVNTEFVLGANSWTINQLDTANPPVVTLIETFDWGVNGHNWSGIALSNLTPANATTATFNGIGRLLAANLRGIPAPLQSIDVQGVAGGVLPLRVQADMARGIRVCAPHLDTIDPAKGCI